MNPTATITLSPAAAAGLTKTFRHVLSLRETLEEVVTRAAMLSGLVALRDHVRPELKERLPATVRAQDWMFLELGLRSMWPVLPVHLEEVITVIQERASNQRSSEEIARLVSETVSFDRAALTPFEANQIAHDLILALPCNRERHLAEQIRFDLVGLRGRLDRPLTMEERIGAFAAVERVTRNDEAVRNETAGVGLPREGWTVIFEVQEQLCLDQLELRDRAQRLFAGERLAAVFPEALPETPDDPVLSGFRTLEVPNALDIVGRDLRGRDARALRNVGKDVARQNFAQAAQTLAGLDLQKLSSGARRVVRFLEDVCVATGAKLHLREEVLRRLDSEHPQGSGMRRVALEPRE